MKRGVLLILIITSLQTLGQDTMNNFYKENSKVMWLKKYQPSKIKMNLYSAMKLSGNFSNIDTAGGQIIANFKDYEANYKGAGYKHSNVALFVSHGYVDGFISVKPLNDTMQIEIRKISFILQEDLPLIGKKDEKVKVEDIAITNKGKFRTGKMWNWDSTAKILDFSFNELFEQLIK